MINSLKDRQRKKRKQINNDVTDDEQNGNSFQKNKTKTARAKKVYRLKCLIKFKFKF